VAGPELGAVRLDSGDLTVQATRARELLDSLGATKTKVIVTSDLDEYAIAALAAAPVDGYGVGTSLVTGSGHPTVGMVYKLVERDGVPVAKNSEGKRSVGGRKNAVRRHDAEGTATAEVVSPAPLTVGEHDRELIVPLVRGGELVDPRTPAEALTAARELHERLRGTLPPEAWSLSRGEPVLETLDA
jgi:nicotinate phosphoribosyltransferase